MTSAETGYKATQARTLRTLASGHVLAGLGIAGAVPAGSLLVLDVTGSEAVSGLAQTFGTIGAAVMAIPLSRLTVQGGRRLALTTGYLVGAIGATLAILGGIFSQVALLFIGVLLVGAASAAGYQARFAAVDLALVENRARQLSLIVWAGTVGSVIGPNLIGVSTRFAENLGLRPLVGPYFFAGFGLLVAAAVIFIWLRPDPFVLSQAETAKVPNPPIRQTLQRLLGNRDELTGLLSISLGHISMIMIMVMTPVHMKHESASIQIIGLVISIHILGMYALAPVMGWLADKYGRIQTIWVGLLILLASAAISATAHNHTTLTIGLFLLGLGWSGTLVAGSALLTEATSVSDRPAVQGVSDLVMNASGALGGALAGIVIAVSSYAALCAVAALPPLYLGVRLLRNH